jgi:ribonuclease BN (tRNA processing enzyme)
MEVDQFANFSVTEARLVEPVMRLILLGTKGGPRLSIGRSAPAQVIVIGERVIVVDCGEGVPHQILRAGIPVERVDDVLITHHHSDHNGSFGNLLHTAWAGGRDHQIRAYGPPPLAAMTEAFFQLNAYDLAVRMSDEGRPSLRSLVSVTEIVHPGTVIDDADLTVRAAVVHHPPVEPAYAFRFDAGEHSIVISGDTTPCDELIELARGATVLVHEVMHPGYVTRLAHGQVANVDPQRMRQHLLRSHTAVEDLGAIATRAGVGTVVLTHLVPGDRELPEEAWVAPVRATFSGQVILGRDLMEIPVV